MYVERQIQIIFISMKSFCYHTEPCTLQIFRIGMIADSAWGNQLLP